MRVKPIEELPLATSAELHQLSWGMEQISLDPRRIVPVHALNFIEKNLQHCIGLIVRVNQHTATLDRSGQKWRVTLELRRHFVDV
jgi:hypothetical protein